LKAIKRRGTAKRPGVISSKAKAKQTVLCQMVPKDIINSEVGEKHGRGYKLRIHLEPVKSLKKENEQKEMRSRVKRNRQRENPRCDGR